MPSQMPTAGRRRPQSVRTPARSIRAEQHASRVLALCDALLSEHGEVSGARLATYALSAYQSLQPDARELFFDRLATQFAPDADAVDGAAAAYRSDPSPANLVRLQTVVEPPRQELFRRANMAPGGTAVLVGMRRELLNTLARASRARRHRRRSDPPVPVVVQSRVPGAPADRLAHPRRDPGAPDPIRSRPRDSGVARPAAPARSATGGATRSSTRRCRTSRWCSSRLR